MTGNTFGKAFKVTTFGESHGIGIGCVIDGCPPGFCLRASDIQPFLDKRKPGQSQYTSPRKEADQVAILSGVFEDKTLGTPIALWIQNQDAKSQDYDAIKDYFRPGHADFTYHHKYGHYDHRGGGRASARETVARVAAGAIARLYLKQHLNIEIVGFLQQMGSIEVVFDDEQEITSNPFFCPNKSQVSQLSAYIDELVKAGDSCGARIGIRATGLPIGLGDPVFDKLDASIAYAMMSINAVKGVEIGDGFAVVGQNGSHHRDEMDQYGFLSNHSGGILGGISTGQLLEVSLALKPTSSIATPCTTLSKAGEEVVVQVTGRHDPCVGIRAIPIAESMLALVLMDHYLRHKAQNLEVRV